MKIYAYISRWNSIWRDEFCKRFKPKYDMRKYDLSSCTVVVNFFYKEIPFKMYRGTCRFTRKLMKDVRLFVFFSSRVDVERIILKKVWGQYGLGINFYSAPLGRSQLDWTNWAEVNSVDMVQLISVWWSFCRRIIAVINNFPLMLIFLYFNMHEFVFYRIYLKIWIMMKILEEFEIRLPHDKLYSSLKDVLRMHSDIWIQESIRWTFLM